MTAIISCCPFISHLPLPLSDSTKTGASSSTSIKLNSIKQSLSNNIKGLLDFNIEHNNSNLFDNKQQQQDINMSMPPTMVPSSSGSAATTVLPQHRPVVVNEENINSKLNQITIGLKLRDNDLYQSASPTLLNYLHNFNSIFFLANSTPVNPNDNPSPTQQINNFINNMRPSQHSTGTTTDQEYFICLTEAEHLFYQQHQTLLGQRPFDNKWQHQKPRLHNDAISALNYIVRLASTTPTESSTYLLNVDNDSNLYLYSFIFQQQHQQHGASTTGASGILSWSHQTTNFRWHQPTWGFLNSIIMGPSAATLSFVRIVLCEGPTWMLMYLHMSARTQYRAQQ